MQNITVIIHTHNEEQTVEACLKSARLLSNEIIVIDSESSDNARILAKKLGAKVFIFPFSSYVEPGREFGIEKAKTEWFFILDADERITKELADEIKNIITPHRHSGEERSDESRIVVKDNDSGRVIIPSTDNRGTGMTFTHYKIPRKNIFGQKKWLKHGGWWPDLQIRLINKKYFKIWPKEIHSTPYVEGNLGYLQTPLLHYFHGDLESMVKKTIIFEDVESDLLFKAKKGVAMSTFFRKFLGELYRRLIRNLGFLDGEIGIIESIYQAFSKTITYIYLYEKQVRSVKKSSSLRPLS